MKFDEVFFPSPPNTAFLTLITLSRAICFNTTIRGIMRLKGVDIHINSPIDNVHRLSTCLLVEKLPRNKS